MPLQSAKHYYVAGFCEPKLFVVFILERRYEKEPKSLLLQLPSPRRSAYRYHTTTV